MFPALFVIVYMLFIIFMNIRKHHIRMENQLVLNQYTNQCTNEYTNESQPYDKYDASILMNHKIVM